MIKIPEYKKVLENKFKVYNYLILKFHRLILINKLISNIKGLIRLLKNKLMIILAMI